MLNNRKVEVWRGGWVPAEFEDIVCGCLFRLYEPDGEFVGEFQAESDVYMNEEGVYMVDCEEVSHGLQ